MMQANPPERFYSLDALRGIAALSVVFWHWQHFFFSGSTPGRLDISRLPWSSGLSILYTKGWLAVDLFFSLSGFIFYWLYSKKIKQGEISSGQFALLRFSRLYPLHIASLLIVAISQLWLINTRGNYFVYPYNDAKHFILNILFTSSWGFEQGFSFNAPTWSVSVEILLYLIFFTLCRLLPIRATILAAMSILGFQLIQEYYPPIGRGLGSFFLGGLTFLMYQAIIQSRRVVLFSRGVVLCMVFAWLATIAIMQCNIDLNLLIDSYQYLNTFSQSILHDLLHAWPVVFLFPLSILSLSLIETLRGPIAKKISFLGDISYSSYLLHFPLQISFAIIISFFTKETSIFYSPYLMALFFILLIAISFFSFIYFEMPMQKRLRQGCFFYTRTAHNT